MKIRTSHITNSSSSSFVCLLTKEGVDTLKNHPKADEAILELLKAALDKVNGHELLYIAFMSQSDSDIYAQEYEMRCNDEEKDPYGDYYHDAYHSLCGLINGLPKNLNLWSRWIDR